MEEAIATALAIALGIAFLATIGITPALWLIWTALRRWGPHRVRGALGRFPVVPVAAVLLVIALPASCGWAFRPRPQPASSRQVRAVEVPLRSPTDRADLIAIFQRTAAANGLLYLDTTESWRTAPPGVRKTLYLALDRPMGHDQEWEIVADDDGPGTDPWVTFFRGADPVRATNVRDRLVAALTARFPDVREVPVMPTGALPFRRDLVRFGGAYRVRADRATDYQLPPGDPAIAPP